jgi:hypothetical protein
MKKTYVKPTLVDRGTVASITAQENGEVASGTPQPE